MDKIKRIALVAHDFRKKDLVEWAEWNWEKLIHHKLVCTGTTGRLIEDALKKKAGKSATVSVTKLKSGPLGGDQQLGAMISEGKIDLVVFFWDPMLSQPHDVDVKALLRITVLYNVITACNRSTADFVISSNLFNENYLQRVNDFSDYINRKIE
jgi:methylglyoxal synthase